jgi:hypothetical protein
MLLAAKSVIHEPGLHVEILAQGFLLKEGVVVTALQEVIEIRNLLKKVTVFEGLG